MLEDVWSKVIIQMGRAADYQGGFKQFKEAVNALSYAYEDGKLGTITCLFAPARRRWLSVSLHCLNSGYRSS